jgi:ribosomal protein L21
VAPKNSNSYSLPVFERYAIFQTGGKQYQALEGKTIEIEKLDKLPGETVTFHDVLLRKVKEGDVTFGQPFLDTPITATIVKHMRGPKVIAFRFKRRKKVRVKRGHRQNKTVVRIETI